MVRGEKGSVPTTEMDLLRLEGKYVIPSISP